MVTPAVVAQRMTDLLQCFPSAAIGGVQWHTLVKKYEEKHGSLDLEALGHQTALAAALALLWDVARIVDASDTDNPVVAVEEAVAMTPSPKELVSWPSLYKVLFDIAYKHGTREQKEDVCDGAECYVILQSQVKPLLVKYWHNNFDELGLSYYTEEGNMCKLKKLKHLLTAVLRWRKEYMACSDATSSSKSEMGRAMAQELCLVPSKSHNDLILCCIISEAVNTGTSATPATPHSSELQLPISSKTNSAADGSAHTVEASPVAATSESTLEPSTPVSCSSADSESMVQELAFLRSENAKLQSANSILQSKVIFNNSVRMRHQWEDAGAAPSFALPEVLDDPFEPPPEKSRWASPMCSTPTFNSGTLTPFSESSMSCSASGYATPTPGQMTNGMNFVPIAVPVWFQTIPTGVVQQARAMFERSADIPRMTQQWFAPQF